MLVKEVVHDYSAAEGHVILEQLDVPFHLLRLC
jgi:hypothetical protein